MVQFDYKGEKGYGHVIEGVSDAAGGGDPDGAVDEGEKGGGAKSGKDEAVKDPNTESSKDTEKPK